MNSQIIGVISLKDIFEEIIKGELMDSDNHIFNTLNSRATSGALGPRVNRNENLMEAKEEEEQGLKRHLLKG